MMKKEIDRNIYESTRCYFNDYIDLYEQFLIAAKSEKLKAAYLDHIQDLNEINAMFLDSFKPRKNRKTRRDSYYAGW